MLLGGSDCAQAESNMVLPKPAGAETSVRGCFRLSASKAVRRGREISVPDAMGRKNLVARSWFCKGIGAFIVASPKQAERFCSLYCLFSILYSQFGEDATDMAFDGINDNQQFLRYFLIRCAVCK